MATSVFINEFHYDNSDTDSGEFIEIAGPAGTDLNGWSLVLYNCASSVRAPYDTVALAGLITDQQSGYGTVTINFPPNGIQNGSPDGLALVDNAGVVVQFLSYEGSFDAASGPAAGLTSTDIGVSENSSTPLGFSLQLSGTGTMAEDFSWQAPQDDTPGAINSGQTFVDGGSTPGVTITESGGATEVAEGGASDSFSLSLDTDPSAAVTIIVTPDSETNLGAGAGVAITPVLIAADAPVAVDVTAVDDTDIEGGHSSTLTFSVVSTDPGYSGLTIPNITVNITDNDAVEPPSGILINEIDADTSGSDIAEFVELFDGGAGNTALDGLVVVFFNGSNDASYQAFDLDGFSTDADGYFVLGNPVVANVGLTFDPGSGGALQNGADAVALFQADATDFPNDTPVTTANLLDAIVYDTNDADDPGLLPLLNDGQPQLNEDGGGDKDNHSLQRIPNGEGGARNTDSYQTLAPTPGSENGVNQQPVARKIHEIQGVGDTSPLVGQSVTIEGIVVGDFQGSDGLLGFYVQEEDSDADTNPLTSEGIFVFEGSTPLIDVALGDRVQVTGTVDEFFGLTELTNVTDVTLVSSNNPLPTAATVNFPVASLAVLEAAEGMRATIPDTLFVTEYFNLDRFGEVRLSSDGPSNQPGTDGRLEQYTQFNVPDVDGFAAYQDAIANRQIVLDDASRVQNPDTLIFGRGGDPLSSTNTLRGGDTVNNLSGILDFRFGDYRIQTGEGVDFQPTNPRPDQPEDVGGDLKVASFNVLNFFTTLDVSGNPGSGPNSLEPRGADSQEEFDRQIDKLVTTLSTLDADILGLVELENEFGGDQNGDGLFAIDTLVDALNAVVGAGTYAFVDPGRDFVDTGDAISVGAIYKTATVKIAENTSVEILDDSDLPGLGLDFDAVFDGVSTNRASLAATFEEIATGEKLTVAVNHFKSKGSVNPADGNEDIGDGQGNNNAIRTQASIALDAWLDSDPTGSNDEDFLIVGDLNAYAREDPITLLESEGYSDLAKEFVGPQSYSFVFDGQFGTLDYAMANDSLLMQVTGATEWHINADEPDALDYNLDFGRDPTLFDGTIPFRTSDHDPLIVSLDLQSDAVEPLIAKATLDYDPSGFFPQLDYSEDDVLLAEVTQFPFAPVRDPKDEVPIEITVVDSEDSFTFFGREFPINVPDKAIATLNDGIAIKDGDDGLFGTDTRRIDGDETLVVAIEDDAAFDFANSAEIRLGKFNGTGVTIEAFRDGTFIGSATSATDVVSFEPSEGFDRLEISANGDTQFTFLGITLFDLFADETLVG